MHEQMEVPAGDVAVPYRVGGQLSDDQHDLLVRVGAVRDSPGVQPVCGQSAGEAGARGVEVKRIPKGRFKSSLGQVGWEALMGLGSWLVMPPTVPSVA